jgi:hypothetical protein
MHTLFKIDEFCKQEPLVRCPHCATSLIVRYGTYQRAHPEKPILVKVPRFLCKSPRCPRITFSVLPHPFLPIVRHFSQTLLCCHFLCNIDKASQAEGVRRMGLSRGVIKRLSVLGRKFTPWFNHEKKIADWGPNPDTNPLLFWTDFTRDFSRVFYPKRWPTITPTQ